MLINISLDLETMGKKENAAIVSIAAVATAEGVFQDMFNCVVDLESCTKVGATIDADTVIFWLRQSREAIESITTNPIPINTALLEFSKWVDSLRNDENDILMYGNGADFDNKILSTSYKMCGLKQPWSYRENACFRTLRNLKLVPEPEFKGVRHVSSHDALHQAKWLEKILTRMPTIN